MARLEKISLSLTDLQVKYTDESFAKKLGENAEQVKELYAPEKIYRMWEDYITEVADR